MINQPITVNRHTNDNNNNRMSRTSSERSAAEILQRSRTPRTAKYIEQLAPTIIEWGGGYMEDDVCDVCEKLKIVPKDTIPVREILTF
jgi:hypothetical protein